jgi:anti-sigma regulatory factor (Ser/Thr protein kinase)
MLMTAGYPIRGRPHAVSEAVSNVAELAYRPAADNDAFDLSARLDELPDGSRRVAITVRDDRCWQPPKPDPGMRGRGLFMMRTLMAEGTIRRGEGAGLPGTEVVMLSQAVPPREP